MVSITTTLSKLSESPRRLTPKERRAIQKALDIPELRGNKKMASVGSAISAITNALDSVGFSLGMVAGDIVLGDKGSRLLTFSEKTDGSPLVDNSRISLTWELMSAQGDHNRQYEIIAYLT